MKYIGKIEFPLPESRNKSKGKHFGFFENRKKKFEEIAYFETKALTDKKPEQLHLFFTFIFPDKKRRDLDNYFSTYEVKGAIDGICRALGVDDSYDLVSLSLKAECKKGEKKMIVEIFDKEGDKDE